MLFKMLDSRNCGYILLPTRSGSDEYFNKSNLLKRIGYIMRCKKGDEISEVEIESYKTELYDCLASLDTDNKCLVNYEQFLAMAYPWKFSDDVTKSLMDQVQKHSELAYVFQTWEDSHEDWALPMHEALGTKRYYDKLASELQ
eukprot:179047_1